MRSVRQHRPTRASLVVLILVSPGVPELKSIPVPEVTTQQNGSRTKLYMQCLTVNQSLFETTKTHFNLKNLQ